MKNVYTVAQVNGYIKNMFTQDFLLQSILVKGEVSNCKYHSSGHIYFTLKDGKGAIACVMFAGNRSGLKFHMQEGQQVVVGGTIDVFERDGRYQLYAKSITLDGAGQLYERFEQLKRELAEFAASLVNNGETVFIENGSSNALLARTLADQKDVTIITVSSYIAHLLKETRCEVILLGGIYQKKSESMVGPLTRQYVQQVHFSKAFIGIDGWQPDTGFTGRDMMRSDVVNAVLAKECEAIVLTDSSKFGAVHPYTMGPASRFSRVITDERLRDEYRQQLEQDGLTVDIVKKTA